MKYDEVKISVPWGHIAGRWYGVRNVRPFLALHGVLDNCGTWDALIPLLPKHIGVLAVDLPGHGKSSRLPMGVIYTFPTFVHAMMLIMQEYNWDKVSLLTHSLSSMVFFAFAAYNPDKVDMLIQIDAVHVKLRSPEEFIRFMQKNIESFLNGEERIKEQELCEPSVYSYDEIIERTYIGSKRSVEKDKCHHLVKNNFAKSTQYPSKYYYTPDPRLKHIIPFYLSADRARLMAKFIKVPQLFIKSTTYGDVRSNNDIIKILQDNNPYFEFHIVDGTHHIHLNNAQEMSSLLNSFINKWRPPPTEGGVNPLTDDTTKKQDCRKRKAKM